MRAPLRLLLLASVAVLLNRFPCHMARAADSRATLKMIADRSEANQRAFATLKCRFRMAVGQAPSIEAALRDGPATDRFTADVTWSARGDEICYEMIAARNSYDKAYQLASAGGREVRQITMPFCDQTFIGNRSDKWHYTLNGVGRIEPTTQSTSTLPSPFNMGLEELTENTSAADLLRDGFQQPNSVRLVNTMVADKRESHEVEVIEVAHSTKPVKVLTALKFDAGRGYLPMEITGGIVGQPLSVRTVVTKAVQTEQGAWYPQRIVQISHLAPDRPECSVRELVVSKLSLIVTDKDLRVTIPKGTIVIDGTMDGAAPTLTKSLTVTPSTLDAIKSAPTARSSQNQILRVKAGDQAAKPPEK